MKTFIPMLVAVLLVPLLCLPAYATDVIDATCRISAPDGSRGSGIAFERSQGHLFVLTNAHVVGNASTVQCEFWHRGHAGGAVPARVLMRSADKDRDVAVVAVQEGVFGGLVPPVIPMAPRGTVLPRGTPIVSVGSAGGTWPTLFRGHVTGYEGTSMYFTPAPANGRSGSGIVTEDGSAIVGVLFARSNDQYTGLAVSSEATYQALSPRTAANAPRAPPNSTAVGMPEIPTQQRQWGLGIFGRREGGGGLCPPGGVCPPQQGEPQQGGGGTWPSLPPDSGQPGPPPAIQYHPLDALSIDLTPINDSLDRIGRSLESLEKRQAAREEAEKHKRIIEDTPKEAGEAVGRVASGDLRGAADVATSEPMLGWLGQILVQLLVSVTGATGVFALAIRFGVPMALRVFHRRFKTPDRNEADDVMDDVAEAVARKQPTKKVR